MHRKEVCIERKQLSSIYSFIHWKRFAKIKWKRKWRIKEERRGGKAVKEAVKECRRRSKGGGGEGG